MPDLPPPGPERNAMVARALGCTTWTDDGCECPDWPHMAADRSSTTNAGAIAALEAWRNWRNGQSLRNYRVFSPMGENAEWEVTLFLHDTVTADMSAPTLGDAASAALIAAAGEGA